ncbi:MAG: hypothetical protein ABR607_00180 [Pyrinomonadaceae bacterium]
MKKPSRRTMIFFLVLVGIAFLSLAQGDNLTAYPAGNSNNFTRITTRLDEMMGDLTGRKSRTKVLPPGLWGGQHISVEVNDQGAAVEYDCAHATMERRITIDRHGRFSVPGTQIPERGGPVRRDQSLGYAVIFKGQVSGKKMTLSVSNSLTKELVGTFTLLHGAQPKLMKCK